MIQTDAVLSRIEVFPIKSLNSFVLEQATLLSGGALAHDRELAIVDEKGKFVNGKRTAQIHGLRSQFDLAARTVSISALGDATPVTFNLDEERSRLEDWLSRYFGFTVKLIQNCETGFPDDLNAPGPTIISTATLQAIADWYPGLSLVEVRQRFRTNLEITGVPAFWEDRLFSTADSVVNFGLGTVTFGGINPCQRCVVPTRDPVLGNAYPNFQKTFVTRRKETLPVWAKSSRFNHFYRVAINTQVPSSEAGKILQLGDPLLLKIEQFI